MLALQVYPAGNDSCLLTFGQYEFSKDPSGFTKYLTETIDKVYKDDVVFGKLLKEILAAPPPLIGANQKIDAPPCGCIYFEGDTVRYRHIHSFGQPYTDIVL